MKEINELNEKPADDQILTKRQYLVRRAMAAGAYMWTAMEAVASVAIEHPEWDMDEEKTWKEWEAS